MPNDIPQYAKDAVNEWLEDEMPADEWIVTKTASEVIKTTASMGKHQISAE